MKHFIISGLVLLLSGITGFASDVVVNVQESHSFKIDYSPDVRNQKDINNFFIREIARHNLTSLYNTSYTYHYTLQKSLEKSAPYTYQVSATILGSHCTGNIFYRDFDISDILKPDVADFTLVVNDKGNSIAMDEFNAVVANDNNVFKVSFELETTGEPADFEIAVSNISFYSNQKDRDLFYERIGYIDNYYAAIAAIDQSVKRIREFDVVRSGPFAAFVCMSESKRILDRIENSAFIMALQVNRDNRPGYYAKLQEFRNQVDYLELSYNSLLRNTTFVKFTQSLSDLVDNYIREVSRFYNLSQETTHSYQPYFYNLGMFTYKSSDLYLYKKGLDQILKKTGFCNDTDAIYDELKIEIFEAYLEKADEFTDKEYFYLARGLLENAERFYHKTSALSLPLSYNIALGKASYGIYNSYIHLIDRAIDIGNYELAENYIKKASEFQAGNNKTIISAKYVQNASEKLVQLYINKGFNHVQNEEFKDAMYCFIQAHSVCENLGVYNNDYVIKHGLIQSRNGYYNQLIGQATESIEKGEETLAFQYIDQANSLSEEYDLQPEYIENFEYIQSQYHQQVYLKLISEGKKLLTAGNYTMAYHKLLQALELEEQFDLEIYEPLPEVFADAATPYLMDQCRLAEIKVKKDELDEAKSIYDYCLTLQSEYGLNYEPELSAGLTMLNNNIFSKQCHMLAESYEEHLDNANNLIDGGDFISALEVLRDLESELKKNYFCEYDQSSVSGMISLYEPAAEYQVLANQAQEALSDGNNDKFIRVYKQMEELSNLYEVIRRRIEPMPLHYLFSVKKNLALFESSVSGYDNADQLETAMKIMHVLEANNTSFRDTRSFQQKLAEKMALADKANAGVTDPKNHVEQYTGGSSFYKYFRKTYIQTLQD
ncbi:MAG: hypothetical protein KDC05_00925 [Bacteroidales bacterium]|nr:hypothetical protein [Bacteroidales bacterium]